MSHRPRAWSGVVLTGGASSRMGTDKAFVPIAGTPMVQRVADALESAGSDDVFAVGGDSGRLAALGLRVLPDRHPGEGPLGGIISALLAARHNVVLVAACDLTEPNPAAMRAVVEALRESEADVAVPVVDGRRQLLHAAWTTRCLPVVQASFESGRRSVRDGIAHLNVHEVHSTDAAAHTDADRPDDLPDASRAGDER